jgi:hypothetical protein
MQGPSHPPAVKPIQPRFPTVGTKPARAVAAGERCGPLEANRPPVATISHLPGRLTDGADVVMAVCLVKMRDHSSTPASFNTDGSITARAAAQPRRCSRMAPKESVRVSPHAQSQTRVRKAALRTPENGVGRVRGGEAKELAVMSDGRGGALQPRKGGYLLFVYQPGWIGLLRFSWFHTFAPGGRLGSFSPRGALFSLVLGRASVDHRLQLGGPGRIGR